MSHPKTLISVTTRIPSQMNPIGTAALARPFHLKLCHELSEEKHRLPIAPPESSMDGLRHQTHPQGRAYSADRVKARLRIGSQCFVQGFAGEP